MTMIKVLGLILAGLIGFTVVNSSVNDEAAGNTDRRHILSEQDEAFLDIFYMLEKNTYKEAAKKPERGIVKAEQWRKEIDARNGYVFASGKVFGAESSMLLEACAAFVSIYARTGDCEKAKLYFGNLREVAEKDYLIVNTWDKFVFDPVIDRDRYFIEKYQELDSMKDFIDSRNICLANNEIEKIVPDEQEYNYRFSLYTAVIMMNANLRNADNCRAVRIFFDRIVELGIEREDMDWVEKKGDPEHVCISADEFATIPERKKK